eukprot:gene9504-59736_t
MPAPSRSRRGCATALGSSATRCWCLLGRVCGGWRHRHTAPPVALGWMLWPVVVPFRSGNVVSLLPTAIAMVAYLLPTGVRVIRKNWR